MAMMVVTMKAMSHRTHAEADLLMMVRGPKPNRIGLREMNPARNSSMSSGSSSSPAKVDAWVMNRDQSLVMVQALGFAWFLLSAWN